VKLPGLVKTIKFSHDYEKLPEGWENTEAILLAVVPQSISYLKGAVPKFLDYDTKFRGKQGSYPLTFENALVLFFVHINSGKPFTTIRRDYPRKADYYKNSVGDWFTLVPTIDKEATKQ